MGSTVQYTVLSRSYKFLTHALTLSMSFCCFNVYQFYRYKTESIQFGVWRPNLVPRGRDPFVQQRGYPIRCTKVTEALGTRLVTSYPE